MTDQFRFDIAPSAEFADRLESRLLRVIGDRSSADPATTVRAVTAPDPEENIVTIDIEDDLTTSRKPPRRFAPILAAAAAVILLVAGIGWLVTRDVDDEEPAVPVPTHTFTVTWAYSDVVGACPNNGEDPTCLYHFEIPATASFEGDVAGTGNQVVLWNSAEDYPGQSVDHIEHVVAYNVRANVAGCTGAGVFMLVETMQFVSGQGRDRDTGTYLGTWQIVEQSGRGNLRSITGSGTSSGVFGTAQDVGRTFTGTIDCP